jgi:hypothetical protein
MYHVAVLIPAFSFWVYWLRNHPNDLQNASVPAFTLLGIIGASWALFGKNKGRF